MNRIENKICTLDGNLRIGVPGNVYRADYRMCEYVDSEYISSKIRTGTILRALAHDPIVQEFESRRTLQPKRELAQKLTDGTGFLKLELHRCFGNFSYHIACHNNYARRHIH